MPRPTRTPLRAIAPRMPAGLLYGGDYNPEQWTEDVWLEDARLMREAGVNLVSVAIFSWAKLEPRLGAFECGWLDRVIAILWEHGVSVCLATATASPPAWFSRAHPESLPVDANGLTFSHGSRQHYCPNSRAYREAAAALTRKIAGRYAKHPAVALWHINNEIGCHINECHCDACATAFRGWLGKRYPSLDALNESWGTAFWSQGYGEWSEIGTPRKMPTFRNPGQTLDYKRFMSDSLRGVLRNEVDALRSVDPDARVTTNGLQFWRQTDYWEWYRHVDIAAWDAYPDPSGGRAEISATAFCHDLFRSLRGGLPFILMEQVTSQVNWRPTNVLKAHGQMRALSLQAVAHGADGVMFFQWRASKAGAEKFHGAMLPHFGPDGRVHAEVRSLGTELKRLAAVAGTRRPSRVALVVSWENMWSLELESKPAQFDYAEIVQAYYRALWERNIAVDIVHPDHSLDAHDVVIAPALYQLSRAQADRLRAFVERGGALVMSYFSGVADERDHIQLGGYPALLKDVLGLVVEEWQPLHPGVTHALATPDGVSTRGGTCTRFSEMIHLHGAQVWATFTHGFLAGFPAVTHHRFGEGEAVYIATQPDLATLGALLQRVLTPRGIVAPVEASPGVEVTIRSAENEDFLFVINHEPTPGRVTLGTWQSIDLLTGELCPAETELESYGVRVLHHTLSV